MIKLNRSAHVSEHNVRCAIVGFSKIIRFGFFQVPCLNLANPKARRR